MSKARTAQRVLVLPERLMHKAEDILSNRGTTLDDFVRLQLKRLTQNEKFYDLDDKFSFGKYRNESVEAVIRGDPEYVCWCLREVSGFALTLAALDVLSEME